MVNIQLIQSINIWQNCYLSGGLNHSLLPVTFVGCRAKVSSLREKLTTCKTLLNCNRDDLRRHWQEGLEFSEILNLLDKV